METIEMKIEKRLTVCRLDGGLILVDGEPVADKQEVGNVVLRKLVEGKKKQNNRAKDKKATDKEITAWISGQNHKPEPVVIKEKFKITLKRATKLYDSVPK